jgi:hypothetical protein
MLTNQQNDSAELRSYLKDCLEKKKPVMQVVAVVGSTAEGCVDNVEEILKMRDDFNQEASLLFTAG